MALSCRPIVEQPTFSPRAKVLLLFGGIAIPIVSHLGLALWVDVSATHPFIASFRSPEPGSSNGWKIFRSLMGVYPLIVFAMACYAWLLRDLGDRSRRRWARFGLFTGLPIALAGHGYELSQLGFGLKGLSLYHLLAIGFASAGWMTWKLLSRLNVDRVYSAIALSFLGAGVLSLIASIYVVATGETSSAVWVAFPLMTAVVGVVLFGPLIWLACLVWVARQSAQRCPLGRQFSIGGLMAWVTWLGIFFAACRHAMIAA